ncbi:uncharacterized protein [Oryctolagus cuniculus]|uniref:uncharacterized protein n=1 Tax=Oryctolagus cuniculus TaxID=9986 RepID=UPI00387947F4
MRNAGACPMCGPPGSPCAQKLGARFPDVTDVPVLPGARPWPCTAVVLALETTRGGRKSQSPCPAYACTTTDSGCEAPGRRSARLMASSVSAGNGRRAKPPRPLCSAPPPLPDRPAPGPGHRASCPACGPSPCTTRPQLACALGSGPASEPRVPAGQSMLSRQTARCAGAGALGKRSPGWERAGGLPRNAGGGAETLRSGEKAAEGVGTPGSIPVGVPDSVLVAPLPSQLSAVARECSGGWPKCLGPAPHGRPGEAPGSCHRISAVRRPRRPLEGEPTTKEDLSLCLSLSLTVGAEAGGPLSRGRGQPVQGQWEGLQSQLGWQGARGGGPRGGRRWELAGPTQAPSLPPSLLPSFLCAGRCPGSQCPPGHRGPPQALGFCSLAVLAGGGGTCHLCLCATCLAQLRECNLALRDLDQLLQEGAGDGDLPRWAEDLCYQGRLLLSLGDEVGAAAPFSQALTLAPAPAQSSLWGQPCRTPTVRPFLHQGQRCLEQQRHVEAWTAAQRDLRPPRPEAAEGQSPERGGLGLPTALTQPREPVIFSLGVSPAQRPRSGGARRQAFPTILSTVKAW